MGWPFTKEAQVLGSSGVAAGPGLQSFNISFTFLSLGKPASHPFLVSSETGAEAAHRRHSHQARVAEVESEYRTPVGRTGGGRLAPSGPGLECSPGTAWDTTCPPGRLGCRKGSISNSGHILKIMEFCTFKG